MAKMNHIVLYGNYEQAWKALTNAQVGRVVRGMLHMLNTGEEFTPKGMECIVWCMVKDQLLRNMEKYEQICEKNRENSKKYWQAKALNTQTETLKPEDVKLLPDYTR